MAANKRARTSKKKVAKTAKRPAKREQKAPIEARLDKLESALTTAMQGHLRLSSALPPIAQILKALTEQTLGLLEFAKASAGHANQASTLLLQHQEMIQKLTGAIKSTDINSKPELSKSLATMRRDFKALEKKTKKQIATATAIATLAPALAKAMATLLAVFQK